MQSAFNTDMNAAAQWPVAVDVAVQVDYPNGQPECSRLRIDGVPAASAVRVTKSRTGVHPAEPELVRWSDLPGQTLFMRALNVLAVHLFGSVEMPPRILGTPLWSALTLELTLGADDPQALYIEVRIASPGRVQLRWRLRRDEPLQTNLVVLDNFDADPLRAMLRLVMAQPQLLSVPATPDSRLADGTTSIRPRGKRRAPALNPPNEDSEHPAGKAVSSSNA